MRSVYAENCLLHVEAFYRSRVTAETNCMKANSFSITYENFFFMLKKTFSLELCRSNQESIYLQQRNIVDASIMI